MSIQQLIAMMQGMGIDATGSNLADITQEQIQEGIGGMFSDEVAGMLKPEMFQTLNPSLLKSASIGSYSPVFQQQQSNLLSDLLSKTQGRKVRGAMGGFAGTGAASVAQNQARDVYGKGMQDTAAKALGARSQSLQTMKDIIEQWKKTGESFSN